MRKNNKSLYYKDWTDEKLMHLAGGFFQEYEIVIGELTKRGYQKVTNLLFTRGEKWIKYRQKK